MNFENEPKTIQDYKDVVKILKLKIIKQNKKIQELQTKNKSYEEQINSVTLKGQDIQISSRAMLQLENDVKVSKEQKQMNMNTLKGKVEVMNTYVRGLKKMGITPQAVFRIADFAYKSYVEADYFRQILSSVKLGLSQKQISCLIFIFDQSYSGFITREDYCNSLNAYKVGVEQNYHQYIHQCAFKMSQMMHSDKINLINFYEEMEGRSKSKIGQSNKKMVDMNVFQEQIKKYYGGRIGQREIVAAFHAVDFQNQGYLEKTNFLYTVTSFINKLLSGGDDLTKKTQNDWSQQKSQVTEPFAGSPKKMVEKVVQNFNFNQSSKLTNFNQAPSQVSQVNQVTPGQSYASRLHKQYGVSMPQAYEELSMYDFIHRMTLKPFKKMMLKVNEKFSSHFLSELFKEIDTQFKGSIYFKELINYYLSNSSDSEMILRLLGRYFKCNDLDSEAFWFMFGLNQESEISKNKFEELMKKTFESPSQKLWENIWNSFARNRQSCNVGTIIKSLQKYES